MMKTILPLAAAALLGAMALPVQGALLANAGKAHYTIVTPAEPTAVDLTAAKELKEHLLKITGAEFPVVPENELSGQFNLIHVGRTKRANQLLSDVDWGSLEEDGIILRTVGNNIVLAGGKTRGSLYAVNTFLEDVLGVRWWTHNESYIPQKSRLNIGNLNIRHLPKIKCREAHFWETNSYPLFASRMKQNGNFQKISPEYGGHYSILGWCHTFYMLIPPEKYFKDHPEWFSLINGKRAQQNAQLCLTNEEMRKELVKNALEWIAKDPKAGIISISQNDWNGECQCEKCQAIKQREGSSSGPLIEFVNKVAADINAKYPDFLIETLAYQYTVEPPKHVKPSENVVIRLCNNGKQMWPLTDERNTKFREILSQWGQIANHLYIWDYIARFREYLYPNPALQVYSPNIKLYEKNKAIAVFMQGDAWNQSSCFVRMRAWVISHLLWNPNSDQDALVREFMHGYFGAAGQHLLQYLQFIQETHNKSDSLEWMTEEHIYRGLQIFAMAEEAVKDDPVLTERVVRARVPLDYLVITRAEKLRAWQSKTKKNISMLENMPETITNFAAIARKHNVRALAEGLLIDTRLRVWENALTMEVEQPTELGDLTGKRTIDLQEDASTAFEQGRYTFLMEDPDASNKLSLKMLSNGNIWALQWHLTDAAAGKWRCYASIKIDAIEEKGPAFLTGIYDNNEKKRVTEKEINIEELQGNKFTMLDLGVCELKNKYYFWFAPLNNPGKIRSITIDRLFLVEE